MLTNFSKISLNYILIVNYITVNINTRMLISFQDSLLFTYKPAYLNVKTPKFGPFLRASEAKKKK